MLGIVSAVNEAMSETYEPEESTIKIKETNKNDLVKTRHKTFQIGKKKRMF